MGVGAVVDRGVGEDLARRIVGPGRVLGQALDDVDPEAVDPPVEPEAQWSRAWPPPARGCASSRRAGWAGRGGGTTGRWRRPRSSVSPPNAAFQLLGFAGRRRPTGTSPASRCPGEDRDSTNHGCWSEVWFGTQSTMTRMPRVVGVGQQAVEVVEGAEQRVDVAVVGHVVAEVGHRRPVERADPDGVDPQPRQVVEPGPDALQVADPVAVGVGEGPGVDLVEDRGRPPRLGHGCRW